TRGQHDSRLYAVRRRDLHTDLEAEDHLPRLQDDKTALEAVTDRLITTGPEQLATTQDPTARAVGALRDQHPLPDLVRRHGDSRDDEERAVLTRAVRAQRDAIACDARLHPTPELLARIGARPDHPSDQRSWDAAVGADAVLRELSDRAVPEPNEFGLPTP